MTHLDNQAPEQTPLDRLWVIAFAAMVLAFANWQLIVVVLICMGAGLAIDLVLRFL